MGTSRLVKMGLTGMSYVPGTQSILVGVRGNQTFVKETGGPSGLFHPLPLVLTLSFSSLFSSLLLFLKEMSEASLLWRQLNLVGLTSPWPFSE